MITVYNQPCKNCLLSPDRIVSPERAKDILNQCAKEQTHFVCHKASMNGENICCHRFYKELGHKSELIRIAERLNVVVFKDQEDSERLPSWKEMELK